MDFHSHLAHTEIIGLLGGNYDVRDGVKLLKVQSVFPCRSTSTGIQVSRICWLDKSTRWLKLMILVVWNGSRIRDESTWSLCRARIWCCWLVPLASYFWTTTKYPGHWESDIVSGRVPCALAWYKANDCDIFLLDSLSTSGFWRWAIYWSDCYTLWPRHCQWSFNYTVFTHQSSLERDEAI